MLTHHHFLNAPLGRIGPLFEGFRSASEQSLISRVSLGLFSRSSLAAIVSILSLARLTASDSLPGLAV